MLPSNTKRLLQNTIDSTESHNRRLHIKQIWKQRECEKKKKRKRIELDEDDKSNWSTMQKIRKQNAKKRRTNIESIMFGQWNHDKFDRMQRGQTMKKPSTTTKKKTIFDALESLKSTKRRKPQSTEKESDSESDYDFIQSVRQKKDKKKKCIAINIKSGKKKQKMRNKNDEIKQKRIEPGCDNDHCQNIKYITEISICYEHQSDKDHKSRGSN